jgi:hypothetical protein
VRVDYDLLEVVLMPFIYEVLKRRSEIVDIWKQNGSRMLRTIETIAPRVEPDFFFWKKGEGKGHRLSACQNGGVMSNVYECKQCKLEWRDYKLVPTAFGVDETTQTINKILKERPWARCLACQEVSRAGRADKGQEPSLSLASMALLVKMTRHVGKRSSNVLTAV